MTVIDAAALGRLRALTSVAGTRVAPEKGDVSDMTKKNVTAENPHGLRAGDVSDMSDVF